MCKCKHLPLSKHSQKWYSIYVHPSCALQNGGVLECYTWTGTRADTCTLCIWSHKPTPGLDWHLNAYFSASFFPLVHEPNFVWDSLGPWGRHLSHPVSNLCQHFLKYCRTYWYRGHCQSLSQFQPYLMWKSCYSEKVWTRIGNGAPVGSVILCGNVHIGPRQRLGSVATSNGLMTHFSSGTGAEIMQCSRVLSSCPYPSICVQVGHD